MSSTRPSAKRVRSDQDHSKADTKKREQDQQSNGDKDGEDRKNDEEMQDDDWMSVGPFQVGKSWEGWETKWRESCWCNKSEHHRPGTTVHPVLNTHSGVCIRDRPTADQVLPLRRLSASAR